MSVAVFCFVFVFFFSCLFVCLGISACIFPDLSFLFSFSSLYFFSPFFILKKRKKDVSSLEHRAPRAVD